MSKQYSFISNKVTTDLTKISSYLEGQIELLNSFENQSTQEHKQKVVDLVQETFNRLQALSSKYQIQIINNTRCVSHIN